MRKINGVALLLFPITVFSAITFEAGFDYLDVDSTTTSAALVDTGLAVSLPGYAGNALIVSSFSGEKTNNSEYVRAEYRLASDGTGLGQSHHRNIEKSSSAAGAGSAVSIANLAADAIVTLQHAENNSSANLTTLNGSTLSVIPMQTGATLWNYGSASATAPVVGYSGATYSGVTTTNAFTVPSVHDGTSEIFIMASLDVVADQSGLGAWQLQFKETSSSIWTDAGNPAQRDIGTAEGIVTLVALADVSASGSYEVRLVQASDGSAVLTTSDVDLVAISLAIDETTYLQSYEAGSIATTGATLNLSPTADTQLFVAANITANSTKDRTGTYELRLNDGTLSTLFSRSTREVDSRSLGSVSLSGIVSVAAADSNSLIMSVDSNDLGFSPNSNFVAFELAAVPEPASFGLMLSLLTLSLIVLRRRS